eukprot:jgi/Mesvir1/25490/Mv01748-RA.1
MSSNGSTEIVRVDEMLVSAVLRGKAELVESYLKNGAVVNCRNQFRCTPLHWAAQLGHCNVAEVLLRFGAEVDARCVDGSTPLHHACREEAEEVVTLLLQHGADARSKDGVGRIPFDLLYDEELAPEIVRALTDASTFDPDVPIDGDVSQDTQPNTISRHATSSTEPQGRASSGSGVDVSLQADGTISDEDYARLRLEYESKGSR